MLPLIVIHDAATGETVEREMTETEFADLVASGWQTENTKESITE